MLYLTANAAASAHRANRITHSGNSIFLPVRLLLTIRTVL